MKPPHCIAGFSGTRDSTELSFSCQIAECSMFVYLEVPAVMQICEGIAYCSDAAQVELNHSYVN